ncbi:MAG: hypothetical protein ACLRWF_07315 [Ruthenibacterium sp.]
MDVKQGLVALFGESPLNWAKWAVVFAVLVLGYAAAVPLSKKVAWRLGWARKRDIAKSRGHSVPATLVEKHPHGQPPHTTGTPHTAIPWAAGSGSITPISKSPQPRR